MQHQLKAAFAAAAFAFGAATLSAAPAAAQIAVTAAYGQPSLQNAPVWIAMDKGLFKKYGLDVTLVQLTGARITQGLVTNSVQFITSTASSPFLAKVAGGDVLLVGCYMNKAPNDIIGNDKVKTLADMKGKTAVVDLRGDFSEFALTYATHKTDIDASKDITILQGFSTDAERLAAITNGSADIALVTVELRDRYEAAGLHRVVSLLDADFQFIARGVFTTGAYAKENPEAVSKYLQALSEAIVFFKNNKAESLEVAAKYMKLEASALEEPYEIYKGAFIAVPAVNEQLVKDALAPRNDDERFKTANPADYFDASFYEKLKADGFFKSIGAES